LATKNVKIEDATASELAAFATMYRGIELPAKLNKQQIVAKLKATGFEDDEILVHVEDAPHVTQRVEPTKGGSKSPNLQSGEKPGRYVTLSIQSTERDKDPQFVSVNGVNLFIPRGKTCRIAYRYFHALQNALRGEYDQDEKTLALTEHRLVPTVPMIVYSIDPEELDTDDHETDAQEKWFAGKKAA